MEELDDVNKQLKLKQRNNKIVTVDVVKNSWIALALGIDSVPRIYLIESDGHMYPFSNPDRNAHSLVNFIESDWKDSRSEYLINPYFTFLESLIPQHYSTVVSSLQFLYVLTVQYAVEVAITFFLYGVCLSIILMCCC